MPRIAAVEWANLDDPSRRMIQDGVATGMYPESLSMQVIANSPEALAAMHAGYAAVFGRSALGSRIQELVRIRSAQLNGCDLCAAARKDETIGQSCEAVVADTPREAAALRLLETMVLNHHAVDDSMLRDLARYFSAREIVELGWFCGNCIGTHRFMHMLDMIGTAPPIIAAEAPQQADPKE